MLIDIDTKSVVFYLEDEKDTNEITTSYLKYFFEKLYSFHNGEEALKNIDSGIIPDLVISDIKMPKLDGIEFLKKCREKGLNMPFILLSAYDDFKYAQTAISLKVADYIKKPVENLDTLIQSAQVELQNYNYQKVLKEQEGFIYNQGKENAIKKLLERISHHWRQPLNLVSLNAESLKIENKFDTLSKDRIDDIANNIILSCRALSDKIDIFMDCYVNFTEKSNFDFLKLMQKVILTIDEIYEDKKIKIDFINDIKEKECFLNFNSISIKNVILSIISNSIEAYDRVDVEEKKIIFEISKVDNNIKISITDFAGGIKDDDLTNIFEPYFSTKKELNGTGLGLYFVKSIVQKELNGTISIKNIKAEDKKGVNVLLNLKTD